VKRETSIVNGFMTKYCYSRFTFDDSRCSIGDGKYKSATQQKLIKDVLDGRINSHGNT